MFQTLTRGSIPEIIRNDNNLYEGNLKEYFKIIFHQAQNVLYPYHNFRHMTHVTWQCNQACEFYDNEFQLEKLNRIEMRILLIAALFHDFNHSGMIGDDDLNIERSIRGLRKFILPEDKEYLPQIITLIKATEYPYPKTMPSESLSLCGKILRDIDLGQVFSVAWIQQVIFGLAAEWNKKPIEVLAIQEPFLRSLKFNTEWARQYFPQSEIEGKIGEARELLQLLETECK